MATEELMEEWENECMGMERELTIFELMLLFKVAAEKEELGPLEPVWPVIGEDIPLWHAPYRLDEQQCLMLAQQQRLIRLEFMEVYQEEPEAEIIFRLTEKGKVAVSWWLGSLEDIGFKHETLKPRWESWLKNPAE